MERGDFGRVKTHSTWNDIVEGTGSLAARARGEPASPFAFTDDERELRDRAWRFLTPAQERPWFDRVLADLAGKRVLPPDAGWTDRTAYARGLAAADAVSPASRYRRLSEDAAADARLLPALADIAVRVGVADGVRLKTLLHAQHVSDADAAGAEERVAENRCLVAWVAVALDWRLAAYRYALEHLVIETPQADAVPAERALAALGRARVTLGRLEVAPLPACAGERAVRPVFREAVVAKG